MTITALRAITYGGVTGRPVDILLVYIYLIKGEEKAKLMRFIPIYDRVEMN